ncbi:MAG: RNA polymerase sigma factor [Phycisphaerales bacterium]|nr:RNA polymerase sigma factor [Phycisphaerales bacterium]
MAGLLAAAGRGDEPSWRRIVDLYARRVYALAKSRCGSHDTAEEIAQSVFVTVATKLGGGAGGGPGGGVGRETGGGSGGGAYFEQGKFESWLFRIAMNRVRDEMRRQKRHAQPMDPAGLRLVGGPADREGKSDDAMDELAALRRAMHRLTDADREVVELRHHAGLSFAQMVDLLEEPMGTLLARHHRALKKLRDFMGGELVARGS